MVFLVAVVVVVVVVLLVVFLAYGLLVIVRLDGLVVVPGGMDLLGMTTPLGCCPTGLLVVVLFVILFVLVVALPMAGLADALQE